MTIDPKEAILRILENARLRRVLLELYEGKKSFSKLKEEAEIGSNTTLSRDLEFLDRCGMIVNIFERTNNKSYSHYELNSYGKRVYEIVRDLSTKLDEESSILLQES